MSACNNECTCVDCGCELTEEEQEWNRLERQYEVSALSTAHGLIAVNGMCPSYHDLKDSTTIKMIKFHSDGLRQYQVVMKIGTMEWRSIMEVRPIHCEEKGEGCSTKCKHMVFVDRS